MLKFKVYRVQLETAKDGGFEFTADGTITEKGGATYKAIHNEMTLSRLAFRLVMHQRDLVAQKRLNELDDTLVIEFPREPAIFHPLNGISRIKWPMTDEGITELWRYVIQWREAHGDSCEI